MRFATIMTIVSHDRQVAPQIAAAAALARRMDAHLDILALGVDDVQMGYYFTGAEAVVQQKSLELARERAEKLTAAAREAATAEGIRWSVNGVVAQFGALADIVARAARFADVVLLPAPYVDGSSPRDEVILETALFSAQAPVLVMPETGLPADLGSRIVIGWNDGSEALRAVRAALPLLQEAEICHVAIVSPPERSADRAEPGRSLSTMLDRHGVKVEVSLLPKTRPRIVEVLQAFAHDRQANLIVAGAYGHSRFRQAILGGATRDLLSGQDLPVLLAH